MNSTNVGETLYTSVNHGFLAAATFVPNIVAGIVILLIGIILGAIVRRLILELFRVLKIDTYLRRYGIPEARKEFGWSVILAEIARWFVIILFLIPTAGVWGLPQITVVLNSFLLYIPNVFVSAIILLVGLVFARLAHDLVRASTSEISADASQMIASVTRWAITIFVFLAVLNQLGVARNLIQILFTGFVAMVAIAGGIAFGLGGQDTARSLLDSLRSGLSTPPDRIQEAKKVSKGR